LAAKASFNTTFALNLCLRSSLAIPCLVEKQYEGFDAGHPTVPAIKRRYGFRQKPPGCATRVFDDRAFAAGAAHVAAPESE
jgi:hypothetical protein